MLHATWSLIRFAWQLLMGAGYNCFSKIIVYENFYLSNVIIRSGEEDDSPSILFLPFIPHDTALQQEMFKIYGFFDLLIDNCLVRGTQEISNIEIVIKCSKFLYS